MYPYGTYTTQTTGYAQPAATYSTTTYGATGTTFTTPTVSQTVYASPVPTSTVTTMGGFQQTTYAQPAVYSGTTSATATVYNPTSGTYVTATASVPSPVPTSTVNYGYTSATTVGSFATTTPSYTTTVASTPSYSVAQTPVTSTTYTPQYATTNTFTQPTTYATQPTATTYTAPSTYTQPTATYTQPTSTYVQPTATNYVQPTTNYAQPTTNYTQPTATNFATTQPTQNYTQNQYATPQASSYPAQPQQPAQNQYATNQPLSYDPQQTYQQPQQVQPQQVQPQQLQTNYNQPPPTQQPNLYQTNTPTVSFDTTVPGVTPLASAQAPSGSDLNDQLKALELQSSEMEAFAEQANEDKRKMEEEKRRQEERILKQIKREEQKKIREQFFSTIVDTTKLVLTNCNRINTVLGDYDDLIDPRSASGEFITNVLGVLQTTQQQLHSCLSENLMNIEDNVHRTIVENANALRAVVLDLMALANHMRDPANVPKYKAMPEEERSNKAKQGVLSATYIIKQLITELEKAKSANSKDDLEVDEEEHTKKEPNPEERKQAIKELIDKQESYTRNLTSIINFWQKPIFRELHNSKLKLMNEKQYEILFGGIEKIQENAFAFARELGDRFRQNPSCNLGDLFLDFVNNKVAPYLDYTKKFDQGQEVYDAISKTKDWKNWVNTTMCVKASGGLDLLALLIMPIQHLPQTRLLFKRVVENTPENHSDYADLSSAERTLHQSIESIMQKQRDEEIKRRVVRIQEIIQKLPPIELAIPSRVYVHDGPLDFTYSSSFIRGHAYLLNDMLILAKVVPGKHTTYEYVSTINIKGLTIKQISMEEKSDTSSAVDYVGSGDTAGFAPLIKPGEYPTLRIDRKVDGAPVKIDLREDVYKTHFYGKTHYNWIGKGSKEKFVISVLADPISNDTYRALKTYSKGFEEFRISVKSDKKSLVENLEKFISDRERDSEVYLVADTAKFSKEFCLVEDKHSQVLRNMKIGIIYTKHGQADPHEMFKNGREGDQCSDKFWNFMKLMGREIDLLGWKKYNGDMSVNSPGKTYFDDTWKNINIVYHLAPMLDPEGHRRLIGNDVAIIFFLEEGQDTWFEPTDYEKLGTVPQIYIVVQPVGNNYRVAFFTRNTIKPFGPDLPTTSAMDPAAMKDLVLTKLYNGLIMSQYCPPMDRLFSIPRGETIKDIVANYKPSKTATKKVNSSQAGVVLQPPSKISFQLMTGPTVLNMYCPDIDVKIWVDAISNTIKSYALNEMLDEGIKQNKSSLDVAKGLNIINGTYGILGKEKYSIEITDKLKDLMVQMGGIITLKPGTKKDLFGNPAPGKRKHIVIVYTINGELKRKTFDENDAIVLDMSS
eukprot:TRINITY_DN1321_c0_g2_i1.p1 TRINITY_DN1321_c0_g2~~TRINITY_DN1321_c0_g2_i1.p1  ORF type:complete len:1345 (-),score=395.48 TRINITY_DN1321_c0_g2_i1:173-4207(-)